ncbi:MAG TPA: guanylate kinase [Thermotogaceae bacterium]|nr:guanylate kinase [Thermotogaceae bacterium]
MGIFYVISGPSGAGKTTILKEILRNVDNLTFSVSYTTRPKRPNEREGADYFFVTEEQFKDLIEKDEFVEWALVHGYYYGTSKKFIEMELSKGYDIVLDIDVQGALSIMQKYSNAVFIFLAPPSFDTLKERLLKRKTESEEDLVKRIEDAKWELSKISMFDYIVINDSIESTVGKIKSIIEAERLRIERIKLNGGVFLS